MAQYSLHDRMDGKIYPQGSDVEVARKEGHRLSSQGRRMDLIDTELPSKSGIYHQIIERYSPEYQTEVHRER